MTTIKSNAACSRRNILAMFGGAGILAATGLPGIRQMAMAASQNKLVWSRPVETVLMDPHNAALSTSWELHHIAYDSLLKVNEKFEIEPALAESWAWEGNDLVFTLRAGVKFANGRALAVDDVVKSLQRAASANTSPVPLLLRNHKEMKGRGDNQVVISFDGPNRLAEIVVASTLASIMPMKEIEAGELGFDSDQFMGTGPFFVEKHVTNDHWVFKKNPHYWQDGLPMVDEIVVRVIPTVQGIIASLRDGSTDLASFRYHGDAPLLLQGIPNIKVVTQEHSDYDQILVNGLGSNEAIKDQRVRQAIAFALNREQIIEFAYNGSGKLSYGYTQFGVLDDKALRVTGHDPEKARALLAEAGAEGTPLTFIYIESEATNLAVQVVKQNLDAVGFVVNLESVDQGTWFKRSWGSNPAEFDLSLGGYSGWSHPLVTANFRAPELAGIVRGYLPERTEYRALLDQAMFADNEADMLKNLQACYEMMNEESYELPMFSRQETVAYREDLISAKIATREGQNNVMSGLETFSRKA